MNIEKFTIGLFACLGIVAVLMLAKSLFVPIVLAFLIWMLIDSVASKLKGLKILERKIPKWLISTSVIIIFSILMLFIYQVIVTQTENLISAAPFYQEKTEKIVHHLAQLSGLKVDNLLTQLYENLNLTDLLTFIADSTQSFLSSIFLVVIYVGFMFVEQSNASVKVKALEQLSDRFSVIQSVFKNTIAMIKRYIRLKSFVSALTSLLCYFVLILFQVDFAELWAISTFLLNFIPNIGSALAVIFPSIIISLQFDSLPYIMVIIGSLLVIQFIMGNVVEPAVMGKSLNLSAFMILISLSFWGFIWGLIGMFLAIPLMVATAIVFSHIEGTKWVAILMSADGQLLTERVNNVSQ
ncbi:AI-2E family transporter [Thalassotalea sp. PLHSN55]|uniref:AI-2E family transporter n=1 Tax=Thalassotalea sp. PLHSN55 TaxID=3435888 RepID=UPI003F87EA78